MAPKSKLVRSDSWASSLTEAQSWELYRKSRASSDWDALGKFAVAEYGIPAAPGRTSFYVWKKRMDGLYHEHKMNEAILAKAEVVALAKTYTDKDELVDAFATEAATIAMRTEDHDLAAHYADIALKFAEIRAKEKYAEYSKAAQEAREKELALAREKWEAAERRLAAATETVTDKTITDEERVAKIKEIFGIS